MKAVIKYDMKPPHLPIAVADSRQELAEILGISRNVVDSSFSHHRSTYFEYEFEDDDDVGEIWGI